VQRSARHEILPAGLTWLSIMTPKMRASPPPSGQRRRAPNVDLPVMLLLTVGMRTVDHDAGRKSGVREFLHTASTLGRRNWSSCRHAG